MKRSSTTLVDDIAPDAKRVAEENAKDVPVSPHAITPPIEEKDASKRIVVKSWAVGQGICEDAEVHDSDVEQTTFSYKGIVGDKAMTLNLDFSSIHPHLVKGAPVDIFRVTDGSLVTFEFTDADGNECEAHARVVQYELIPGIGVPPPSDTVYCQMMQALTGIGPYDLHVAQKGAKIVGSRRDKKSFTLASSAEDLIAKAMPADTKHERGYEFDSLEFVWNDEENLEAHAVWRLSESDDNSCAWVFVKKGDLLICL